MNALANLFLPAAALALAAAPLAAQNVDMIGATFSGTVQRLDSAQQSASIGITNLLGANAGAMDDQDRFWIVRRRANLTFELGWVDPQTMAYTAVGNQTSPLPPVNVGDIRGLAFVLGLGLVGVRDDGGPDTLVLLNRTSAFTTVIGPTGMGSIQSLDATSFGLRGFDLNLGLVQIDPTTGLASDLFPGVGTGGVSVQWMATDRQTGRTYAGDDRRWLVDHATGLLTEPQQITCSLCADDFRAMEFLTFRQKVYGSSCGVAAGIGSEYVTALHPHQQDAIRTSSGPHLPGAIGLRVVGLSDTAYGAIPLPMNLDPLLGTAGCQLLVSGDLLTTGFAAGNGVMSFSLPVPAGLSWLPVFVQHATFEPVPGGMVWTPAVRARLPF